MTLMLVNNCLTTKLLDKGYQYHKLKQAFSKFYRRHHELVSKFNVEPEFYGDLVYKFKKNIGRTDFLISFEK